LEGVLDERSRRLVAAAEAVVLGFGGTTAAPVAGGLSGGTILRGITELKAADKPVCHLPPGTSKWNKIRLNTGCFTLSASNGVAGR